MLKDPKINSTYETGRKFAALLEDDQDEASEDDTWTAIKEVSIAHLQTH
jgi:hypothetical protein